eukprot:GFYU01013003.1.p1 GENE.GFYU01013003.1~~GFYU01013003.1.p1  ORF type:complete len:132 (-),score=69.92 GFYU01013003.1:317-676(-)
MGEDDEDDVEDAEGDEEEELDEDELRYQKEVEAESKGIAYSEVVAKGDASAEKKGSTTKRKRAGKSDDVEEKELAKMMMTKKNKRLYDRMQYGIEKKQAEIDKLHKKRKAAEKAGKGSK